MTAPDTEAVGGECDYEHPDESELPPAASDQIGARVPRGVDRLKARDIEAIVLAGPRGDPMAQYAWSSVRSTRNRIVDRWVAIAGRLLGPGD